MMLVSGQKHHNEMSVCLSVCLSVCCLFVCFVLAGGPTGDGSGDGGGGDGGGNGGAVTTGGGIVLLFCIISSLVSSLVL